MRSSRFISFIKSKRGAALESAILFMVVLTLFSILLCSVALTGHLRTRVDKELLLSRVAIEQIAEDYLAAVQYGTPMPDAYQDYTYVIDDSTGALQVYHKQTGKLLLYVLAQRDEGASKARIVTFTDKLPE